MSYPTLSAPCVAGSSRITAAATVSGDGSTALQPFLENALGRTQATSTVKVSLPYSGVGSGQGQQDFLSRTVNYGVSDIPLTTTQYNSLGSRPPTGNNISIITRADNSGTTALFTSYLVKASPSVWNLGSGLSVNFPTTVRGVTGTNSVVAGLSAVGNSIGYATSGAGVAAGLTEVALRNFNGQYLTSVQGNYDELANQLVLPAPTGDWSTVNLTYINAASLRSVAAINAPATPDFGLAFSKPANAPIVTGGTSG
ncbi:hypothetical protein WJX84_009481 [Apatococcus fuscideae]|uniref:Uncharacterized protein n=1 Tax=Apatococcus fuscideae TaxID=2026836 RepID=A0AAW1TEQ7_9CHLO